MRSRCRTRTAPVEPARVLARMALQFRAAAADAQGVALLRATATQPTDERGLTVTTVKLLALWVGWCDDCFVERPLALTEHGEHGLRAWLKGVGSEDHRLVLACEVCGTCQDVPLHDEDDPAPQTVPTADEGTGAHPAQGLIALPQQAPTARTVVVPHPRPTQAKPDLVLDLVSQGFDVLSRPR